MRTLNRVKCFVCRCIIESCTRHGIELYKGKLGANSNDGGYFDHDYAGEDGKTKISNGANISAKLPVKVGGLKKGGGIGASVEQSQMIDGDLNSSDFKEDYGVYAIYPILQPKSFDNVSDKIKDYNLDGLSKSPSISSKNGKNKEFYGFDGGMGASLFIGLDVNFKLGINVK